MENSKQIDNDIFDTLYETYWASVYNSAFKHLSDRKKASEVTKEAFFQLWLNKGQITGEGVILFLLRAVQNEIFKLMEKDCIEIAYPPAIAFEDVLLPGLG